MTAQFRLSDRPQNPVSHPQSFPAHTAKHVRLVLFVRYPVPGSCKTRLIPAVGSKQAATIHRRLSERTFGMLQGSSARLTIAYTGSDAAQFSAWLGNDAEYVAQVPGSLSERLVQFADDTPAIFFGADTPDLSARHVTAAIAALQTHPVVIGPASDGGYYLIGMREPLPELFSDMPWSTPEVLPETLRRLDRLGIEPLLLETLSDCDRPEDLDLWPELRV